MKSRYQLHVEKWAEGCGAEICSRASRRCFARGSLPCDVLFIGEAPGASENVAGRPFVGPAGKLLDHVIERSLGDFNQHLAADDKPGLRWAFTNVVACIPREKGGAKADEPDQESIEACSERLNEFLDIASPRLVVLVGRVSRDLIRKGYKSCVRLPRSVRDTVSIDHPAFVLRAPVAQQAMIVQKSVAVLFTVCQIMFPEGGRSTT